MPVSVVCPQCGYENKSVAVFCGRCGSRMGAPSVQRRREAFPIGRVVAGAVRGLVLLAIISAIGLIFWPAPVPETAVDATRARQFAQRLAAIEQVLQQQGTTVDTVSAADINNYLAWRIQETPGAQESSGLQMSLDRLYVDITTLRIRVIVLGGLGPLKLSFEVKGTPERESGGFRLAVYQARVGHLRVPGFARRWVADKITQALSGLSRERAILDRTQRFDLLEGNKIRMAVSGRG